MALDGEGRTGGTARFNTAAVHVVFQTRPGVGDDKIIKNAGDATLTLRSGGTQAVTPVDGVYHFDLPPGDEAFLELFGIDYQIQAPGAGDADVYGGIGITQWDDPLLSAQTLKGVQQRLQILGYYTGKVDGLMGQKSERAILEFQADEGSLLIDGDAGPKTQKALDAFIQKNGKDSSGQYYLIRRYLLRFERARTGDTSAHCPHPDYRGGDLAVVSCGFKQIATASADRKTPFPFNVGLDTDQFLPGQDLAIFPKFRNKADFAAVNLVQPDEAYRAANRYDKPYLCITPTAKDGEDILDLHGETQTGPVLGSVRVKMVAMKQVQVLLHLVTIEDAAGNSVPPWTEKEAKHLLGMINAVWMPMGVEFQVVGTQSDRFVGLVAGSISSDNDGILGKGKIDESEKLWADFNVKKSNTLDMYFSEELIDFVLENGVVKPSKDTLGFAMPRSLRIKSGHATSPVGICVRKDPNLFTVALTVAHELGHVLNLACVGKNYFHADCSDNGPATRFDIWSRTRLMAFSSNYFLDQPPRQWQVSTYGGQLKVELYAGAWITVKHFSKDNSDGELDTARDAIDGKPNQIY